MAAVLLSDAPMQPITPPFCLCLVGPTASGKTATALAVADALSGLRPVEIVSVDSALVYRGMDIGTAKPSTRELAAVPHHLISIVDPAVAYSAARFAADATAALADITSRGKLPLLVGGTMLYFKALFEGLDAMPAADPAVRAALDARAAESGWPALHAELALVDPATAARLSPNDAQRIQRALEVFLSSGRALSAFQQSDRPRPAMPPMISLEPDDRAWLHARIAERYRHMLAAGLIDEVAALRTRGDLTPELPSMRCVGYRQTWEALECGDFRTLEDHVVAATRQLAKRQLTWLRSMPQRERIACDSPCATRDVVARAVELAQGGLHQ